jgi:uncharacterized protein (TIGR02001 family)
VGRPGPRPRRYGAARAESLRNIAFLALAVASFGSQSACAQVSGSVTVASDNQLRGRSVSSGRPAVSLALAYDESGGFYVDGAASASWTHSDSIALIGGAIDAGYAWRTDGGVAIDVGAARQQFTRYFSGGQSSGYSEVYVGIARSDLSARLSYSPDYFARNSHALYLSLDRAIRMSDAWRVTAHVGAIAYLSSLRVSGLRSIEYDYAIGIARRWNLLEIRLGASSGGPDPDYYGQRPHRKTRLAISGTFVF